MNGQQLTNSSNSANGTPSSSYPASLSSQSSRDPSPATRPGAPRKPFTEPNNHVISTQSNHWPKDKINAVPSGFTDIRQSPQTNQYTPVSSTTPTPPVSSAQHQGLPHPEIQGLKSTVPQAVGNPSRPFLPSQTNPAAPSSQPMYRFPPPNSLPQTTPPSSLPQQTPPVLQTNHLPQPVSLPNQFPTVRPPVHTTYPAPQSFQPPEPPRSTQSSLQQPTNLFQAQTPSQSMTNNQFQKMPAGPRPVYQFSQPPNQIAQPPIKSSQPLNQSPQPLSQIKQPHNQYSQLTNQSFKPPNQITQPPTQFSQPPNQIAQLTNQVQSSNHFSHTPSQFPQQMANQTPLPPYNTTEPTPQQQYQSSRHPQQAGQQLPNQTPLPSYNTTAPTPQQQYQSSRHPQQAGQQLPNQTPLPPYNTTEPTPQQQYQSSRHPQQAGQQLPNQFNKRYPQMPQQPGYQQQPGSLDGMTHNMSGMSINQGFNKLWGMDTVDLLKCRDLLPKEKMEPPPVRLQQELYEAANCSPEIFRCTLTKIPETKSLLDKSRLPLGVLIHPFKDLNEWTEDMEEAAKIGQVQLQQTPKQLSVIQCTVIVRCRVCRTYINPFVYFVDNKRWKCNLCFRVNELPDEFQFDPMTKTYGDPSRRPEIKSATIEFIAPSEYMVRPPQPAIYVFVLDVSRLACECGYLDVVCRTLLAELDNVPGDARASIAFITFDSAVHFYSLTEGQAQPHQMVVVDIDDMFLPTPDNLLVSLSDCRELIRDLLQELPNKYRESYDTQSALGAALQAAYKLLVPTGGRVTVFQACLPNVGPGALSVREDPAQRAGDNPPHLNPSTDFYKKLALDCSGQQIAVDLFLVNSQYLDLATISGVSRFSGGCMHHIPLFRSDKPLMVDTLERMFQRYLSRKIGFESVMRLRCTRGLSIHTFHGNFFVRSTDLLSLPNANPDAGFGMQVTIDDNLSDVQNVCFQAALLYTSSKGERRIRVHTLCLPVVSNLAEVMHGADQQCIVGLLAKMAVDRAIQSSLSDAREAFVNVASDVLSAYKLTQSGSTVGCILAPASLRLLPLYVLALLKHMAFRVGQSTRLDDRVFAMCQMKSLPLTLLIQSVYPDLYSLLNIEQQPEIDVGDHTVPQPPRLQLSAERVDSLGLYLLDDGVTLLVYVGHNLDPAVCQAVFDVPHFSAIPTELFLLPELDNPTSKALRNFITYLQNEKPFPIPLQVVRDDSHHRMRFLERLIEDKNESGTSYYEFLQRVKSLIK